MTVGLAATAKRFSPMFPIGQSRDRLGRYRRECRVENGNACAKSVTLVTGSRKTSPVLTTILFGAAAAAAVLTVAVMLGFGLWVRVLGVRIRVTDTTNLLVAGAALSAVLFLYPWARQGLRRIAILLLTMFALLTLIAIARQAAQAVTVGDLAVIESDTIQALHGRVLLGPYSRFGWHHPGPLYFYVLAPFYCLSGYRPGGLFAGALAINLLSIVMTAWVTARNGSGALAIGITAACVLFVGRFNDMFVSPWNPHVLVLPVGALVVTCAAIVGGRTMLLPLAALFASFAGQTHVGLMPVALALPGVAFLSTIINACRCRDPQAQSRAAWTINATLWTIALLWLCPLVDQLTRDPGNLRQLWAFFVANRAARQ
jgi:hypothetical protein